jgi:hypothetical protein
MSYSRKRTLLISTVLLLFAVLLYACGQPAPEPTPEPPRPTAVITPTSPPSPSPTDPAEPPAPALEIPFETQWAASGHAQAESESFTHWNEEDPAEIPVTCAKCHSSYGFHDYVGADGSAFGEVNAPAEVGTVITCVTCHNDATVNLNRVIFPSGIELTGLGNEAICMTCHQGTASMAQVDAAIERAGVTDEDTVTADLGFTNIHYYAAAVTRYGTVVKGGYEYAGKTYDALFDHVQGVSTCTECHDSHSLEVKAELCTQCHIGATTVEAMRDIRTLASVVDYDGDGDVQEGVYYEIEGLRNMLYAAIQAYAQDVSQTPIVYDSHAYPYFFIDTNADGQVSTG